MEEKMENKEKETKTQKVAYLLSDIEENVSGEATARQGYYKLIAMLDNLKEEFGLDVDSDIDSIEEIISDELNHAEILKGIAQKYSGIKTAES